jgi:putative NADPH-quinone reductase
LAVTRRIAIIQGHPDPSGDRFGHALAGAYAEGARKGGHQVRTIDVARLDFPLLRTQESWTKGGPPEAIRAAQETIAWAEHILILYPLWLGSMPALLKAFFEQLMRPGFGTSPVESGRTWKRLLGGRSARIVVTMGMPALFYRWYFRAHSLKSFERNILRFVGIAPIHATLIGMVESGGKSAHAKWLERLRALGASGR